MRPGQADSLAALKGLLLLYLVIVGGLLLLALLLGTEGRRSWISRLRRAGYARIGFLAVPAFIASLLGTLAVDGRGTSATYFVEYLLLFGVAGAELALFAWWLRRSDREGWMAAVNGTSLSDVPLGFRRRMYMAVAVIGVSAGVIALIYPGPFRY